MKFWKKNGKKCKCQFSDSQTSLHLQVLWWSWNRGNTFLSAGKVLCWSLGQSHSILSKSVLTSPIAWEKRPRHPSLLVHHQLLLTGKSQKRVWWIDVNWFFCFHPCFSYVRIGKRQKHVKMQCIIFPFCTRWFWRTFFFVLKTNVD